MTIEVGSDVEFMALETRKLRIYRGEVIRIETVNGDNFAAKVLLETGDVKGVKFSLLVDAEDDDKIKLHRITFSGLVEQLNAN